MYISDHIVIDFGGKYELFFEVFSIIISGINSIILIVFRKIPTYSFLWICYQISSLENLHITFVPWKFLYLSDDIWAFNLIFDFTFFH